MNTTIKVIVVVVVAILLIVTYFAVYHNNPVPPNRKTSSVSSVEFTESGLPSGKMWTVNLAGSQQTSSNGTIMFSEKNGTYSYVISTADFNFGPSAPSGSISVEGKPVVQPISFLRLYNASFFVEGLPSGTRWFLNVSDPLSFNSTSNSIVIHLPNGSYSYTIQVASNSYEPAPSQSSGSFSISGSPVSPAPQSAPIMMVKMFPVTFNETGLRSGKTWYVNVSQNRTLSSNNSTISFYENNGTFNFTAYALGYAAYPSYGNFTVSGSALNVSIKFTELFSVTFKETGLPSGKYWSVELGKATLGSTSTSISFKRPNGTYTYTIIPVKGYSANPPYGNVTVNGVNAKVAVNFTHNNSTNYSVVFTETGLPAGSIWTVEFNGTDQSSSNDTITFYAPNSTYPFYVANVSTYSPSPDSGNVTVNGSDQDVSIDFTNTTYGLYEVTFTAIGLYSNSDWTVNVYDDGGFLWGGGSTSYDSMSFYMQNGTYFFTVGAYDNNFHQYYTAVPDSGNLTVDGSNQTVTITFYLNGPSNGPYIYNFINMHIKFHRPDYFSEDFSGLAGSYDIYGSGTNLPLQSVNLYSVTVDETGLIQHDSWCYQVSGYSPDFAGNTVNGLTKLHLNYNSPTSSILYIPKCLML